jgi:hypothetical protein
MSSSLAGECGVCMWIYKRPLTSTLLFSSIIPSNSPCLPKLDRVQLMCSSSPESTIRHTDVCASSLTKIRTTEKLWCVFALRKSSTTNLQTTAECSFRRFRWGNVWLCLPVYKTPSLSGMGVRCTKIARRVSNERRPSACFNS